jgi:hypothetical protein
VNVRIPSTEWKFDLPDKRKLQLYDAPDGAELIEIVASEVRLNEGRTVFCWESAVEKIGWFRAKVIAVCSPDSYDRLFNGPTGYRAHYYSAESAGEAFNAAIVSKLVSEVVNSAAWPAFNASIRNAGLPSLSGQWAKIGFNDCAFRNAAERELLPDAWVAHCKPEAMGLRAPRHSKVEIAGAWINPVTGTFWNSPDKADRSQQIHWRGYA